MMKFDTNVWARTRDVWRSRDEPEGIRRLADVYWNTLLFLAACALLGTALSGSSRFLSALGGNEDDVTLLQSEGGLILFNRAEFEATFEGFESRQNQYAVLKQSTPAIADPSR